MLSSREVVMPSLHITQTFGNSSCYSQVYILHTQTLLRVCDLVLNLVFLLLLLLRHPLTKTLSENSSENSMILLLQNSPKVATLDLSLAQSLRKLLVLFNPHHSLLYPRQGELLAIGSFKIIPSPVDLHMLFLILQSTLISTLMNFLLSGALSLWSLCSSCIYLLGHKLRLEMLRKPIVQFQYTPHNDQLLLFRLMMIIIGWTLKLVLVQHPLLASMDEYATVGQTSSVLVGLAQLYLGWMIMYSSISANNFLRITIYSDVNGMRTSQPMVVTKQVEDYGLAGMFLMMGHWRNSSKTADSTARIYQVLCQGLLMILSSAITLKTLTTSQTCLESLGKNPKMHLLDLV